MYVHACMHVFEPGPAALKRNLHIFACACACKDFDADAIPLVAALRDTYDCFCMEWFYSRL